MRESFDHPPGGVAQQLGIGIQSDDKTNALELRAIARTEKSFQLRPGFTDEKSIELLKLAALALPADPALLALAPHATAMEKKEVPRSVSAIQFLDAAGNDVDIFCVLRHTLPRGVRKICQERNRHEGGHEQEEASEVSAHRVGAKPSARPFRQGYSGASSLLEHRPARIDQIIPDVARNFVPRGLRQREGAIDGVLLRTI